MPTFPQTPQRTTGTSGTSLLQQIIGTSGGSQYPAPFQQTFGLRPTAQQKIARTNTKFGNPGIAMQQGTTYAIYDSLPLDGRTSFDFFQNVNTRAFPLTNINENKLQVGESMAVQWLSVYIMVATAVTVVPIVSVNDIQTAALTSLYRSDFSFFLDNNRVVKPIPLNLMQSKFNPQSQFATNDILHFATDIVIPSLIQFRARLDTSFATVTANTFLVLQLGGTSAILAPKETY